MLEVEPVDFIAHFILFSYIILHQVFESDFWCLFIFVHCLMGLTLSTLISFPLVSYLLFVAFLAASLSLHILQSHLLASPPSFVNVYLNMCVMFKVREKILPYSIKNYFLWLTEKIFMLIAIWPKINRYDGIDTMGIDA